MDAIEEFGLLVKALTREADRRINDLLRPLGITTSQAEALQLLDRYGPLSLGELGTLLIAEGGHPSRLVDRLVASGLLQRESASDDRRRIEISCTPRGRELAHAARERKEIFRTWMRGRLDGLDLTSTTSLLATCLVDTPLSETVHQRRTRPLAGEIPQQPEA
ncbi:MarR family transcriptional regulator [Streptomyces sp. NBC_01537]|uniref:MarR family winged helix-turn-helix transcriptional regulator n=1 Tax=Streptomyces sp. NBC_01537 TaxID=2903896 RepID=UPI00386419E3